MVKNMMNREKFMYEGYILLKFIIKELLVCNVWKDLELKIFYKRFDKEKEEFESDFFKICF